MQQPMTVNLTEPNISTELIQEQAAEVKLLMKKYQKVFSQGNHDLGFAKDVRHYIDTEDQRPFCLKPTRSSAQAEKGHLQLYPPPSSRLALVCQAHSLVGHANVKKPSIYVYTLKHRQILILLIKFMLKSSSPLAIRDRYKASFS